MSAQGGSATNVVPFNAVDRRPPRIVAAARVISIDYQSIVDSAVAGLVHNTPDSRREVYAQARGIVKRHLQLMRLPEPIIELEKLALDVTIRKVEREWRARQAAAFAVPELELEVAPPVAAAEGGERVTAAQALGAFGQALAALGGAFASLLIVLGLRPILTIISALLWPLRFVASPVGIAAALPIVAMAVFFVFFVDNNIAYKSLVDGPGGRLLSRLDIIPSAPAPRSRTKTPDRARSTIADAREPAPPAEARSTVPDRRGVAAEGRAAIAEAPPNRTPTRVRPVSADLATTAPATPAAAPPAPAKVTPLPAAAVPAPAPAPAIVETVAPAISPAPELAAAPTGSVACGSGLSMAERLACAAADPDDVDGGSPRAGPSSGAQATARSAAPPAWLDSYAAIDGVAVGRPATGAATSRDEAPSAAPAMPSGAGEPEEAAPIVVAPGEAPRAPPPPRTPLIKPANAKVTALIDSGKRASVKGDLDRAVHDYTEAIRIDPKYPDSYAERGQAMFKLGETERAIADYTAAIQRDPQHGTAIRSRGMAYLYRGSSDLALADLTKAIELADNDPNLMAPIELFYARRSRASILGSKQQYDREIGDYTALVDSYTRDPMVIEALKANYGDVGAANILATIYRQRATAYIRQQNWDMAIADLTAAVPLGSDRGYTALVDRSKLYEGLGQRDKAVADLQNALAVRPGSEEVRLALRRLGAPLTPGLSRP